MKAVIARLAVFLVVAVAVGVRRVGGGFWTLLGASGKRPVRVFMIGAFDSAGWVRAHAGPLAACSTIDEVYVICDEAFELSLPGVEFRCPSSRVVSLFGRSGARIVTLLWQACSLRPQVYMGYHIMPNAPLALLAAGFFGGKAIYQMTGGPIQIIDGGYLSENPLLRATAEASKFQEGVLSWMVKQFDAVIVRGKKAEQFLKEGKLAQRIAIITGAIDTDRFKPASWGSKKIDVVTVSRLVRNFKGVERFLEVIQELSKDQPEFRASIVGDGPARAEMETLAAALGLGTHLRFEGRRGDVTTILERSKVFVLLSPSEGMSIAMLEALAAGLPVVVTDVGELGDAILESKAGALVNYSNPRDAAEPIRAVLQDPTRWQEQASAARRVIEAEYGTTAVSQKWDRLLGTLLQTR